MKDPQQKNKKATILCNHLKLKIKELAKATGLSYPTLVGINKGNKVGPIVIKAIDEYIKANRPGLRFNPLFFSSPEINDPFIKVSDPGSPESRIKKIKVDSASTIGTRFRMVRQNQGLSQNGFAEALKSNKHTIQSIEYNRMAPPVELIRALKHRGFIESYEEVIDGVKDPNLEDKEKIALKQRLKDMESKVKALEDDVALYKRMLKQYLPGK
jgi:DNA-binding XRE family transcriptional regulator